MTPWKRRALIAGGAVLALLIAYLGGRYSAPAKMRVTERVVEKVVRDESYTASAIASARAEWAKTVKTRVLVRTLYVDGKPSERVETRDTDLAASGSSESASSGTASGTAHTDATRDTDKTTVSDAGRPGWSAGVGALWDPGRLALRPDRVTLSVDRRLWGSLWLGVQATGRISTDVQPMAGASARLEW